VKTLPEVARRTIEGLRGRSNTRTLAKPGLIHLGRGHKGAVAIMKRRIAILILLVLAAFAERPAAAAQLQLGGILSNLGQTVTAVLDGKPQGVIVRTTLGPAGLQAVCLQNGCTVVRNLDDGQNQLFLVQPTSQGLLPSLLAAVLRLVDGIVDAEPDQLLQITAPANQAVATNPPSGLWDTTPVNYYGANVWTGYISQPATQIIRLPNAQSTFQVGGAGIVADIDTGVDPTHPVLAGVLLEGYDFTRNLPGGSELRDISGSAPPPCTTCVAANVNQQTVAMVDQQTAAMVDGEEFAAFGHGTMVAGVIHLTAPTAQILPLKAFHADGTGDLSDILSAIYYAAANGAKIINMSFDMTTSSTELGTAVNYASNHNIILVASSGNDGKEEIVYPAGLRGVLGVASTNDEDQRSSFSNYGDQIVWVAAPGEGIITTYPFGNYAAGWGTSFSSPFVAGTASLILKLAPQATPNQAAWALAHAQWIGLNMGNGRLDVYDALFSLDPLQGLLP
jgi:subtilisin family serine protease